MGDGFPLRFPVFPMTPERVGHWRTRKLCGSLSGTRYRGRLFRSWLRGPEPSASYPGSFAAAMRRDGGIEGRAIDRLEDLLARGVIPKPDEINAVLFDPKPSGDK